MNALTLTPPIKSDTPLTDSYDEGPDCPLGHRPVSFCRDLERQLYEARAMLEESEHHREQLLDMVQSAMRRIPPGQRFSPVARIVRRVHSIADIFAN